MAQRPGRNGTTPMQQAPKEGRKAGRPVRFTAWLALFWERLWPLAAPAWCVLLAFLIVSWLGLWQIVPGWLRYAGLAGFAGALAWALLILRELRLPKAAEITRRIEQATRLEDRPLLAQEDRLATGGEDGFGSALWQAHQRRMAERLDQLNAGMAAPDANRKDPWALRAMLAVTAFAALGFSYGAGGGSVADSLRPPANQEEILSRLDAWIDPPSYTRKPPVYLTGRVITAATGTAAAQTQPTAAMRVPQGSRLTLRFVGDTAIEGVFETASGVSPIETGGDDVPVSGTVRELQHQLDQDGTIRVLVRSQEVASWPVEVEPDQVPTIAFTEPPSSALSGSLQLSYEVADDYGIKAARAIVAPAGEDDPEARPLYEAPDIPLALPRRRATSGTAKVNRDLTSHPWAGGEVTIHLEADDDAGQTGRSGTQTMVLPGRRFSQPVALALIEQRRVLSLDARSAPYVADLLDAVLTAPDYIDDLAAFTAMKTAYRRIVSANDDDDLRSAADLLWEIALDLEFGDMSEAERRLREAQERLAEALENGASDEEIQRLMEELRQAMNDFMEMLAREAMQNPLANNPLDQNQMGQTLRQSDLERMMDQIENLARSGSRDAARQLLSELQRMMDNMRAGRHMQQRQAEGNRMNQALDKLSEMMQRQQQLLDETFRMQQQQPGQRQDGQQQRQQQQQGQQQGQNQQSQQPMTPEEFAEALRQLQQRQQGLQEDLQALGEQLEGLGLDPSREFGEAGREMGEAGENLGEGRPGSATTDQGQALEALRRGAQSMMQQMAGDRQQGGQQQGEGMNGGQDRQRADPLGRTQQAQGLDEGDDTRLPDEIDAQRAREIMEAIRKRLAEPSSPLGERRYLERLLETQ